MIKFQLESLLTSLMRLQFLVEKGVGLNLAKGICGNLESVNSHNSNTFILWLKENVSEWEKFSGSSIFPVASPNSLYSAMDYYMKSRQLNVWEGEYGEDRKELLQWCIDRITKQLKEI